MSNPSELTPEDWRFFFANIGGALRAYAVETTDTSPFVVTPEDVYRATRNGIVVLPLHRSPQAQHDRDDEHPADPEPRDVGHPEYEDARAHPAEPCGLSEPLMRPLTELCGECAHPWGSHPGVQRKISRGLRTPTDPGMRPELSEPSAPAPECTCGHPEWNHGRGGCGTVISYDPHRYCTCTWEPSASVPGPSAS